MKSYLKTENLTVGYHGKPLIEEVSLCVQRGKIVTLIGPNGSGKSTILKTVIGQLPELSGIHRADEVLHRMGDRGPFSV
jgi:iron complex transport system ATP-binding protein